MGRDKRNENRVEHYTQMVRPMMETDAWRALPTSAQALYVWLRLEWKGKEYNNNGKIRMSVRQAAERLGCNMKTAARAFHELQKKGFIFVTEGARLGLSGDAKSPSLELTELPVRGATSNTGRKLYKQWKEGHDFPVSRASIKNPSGRNGEKPRPQNRYALVPIFGTKR